LGWDDARVAQSVEAYRAEVALGRAWKNGGDAEPAAR
jgi:hypothetical protein